MPKKRSTPTDAAAGAAEVDPSFAPVVAAYARDPRVTFGRMMTSPGLKVNGKIFAMLTRAGFVVKLPKPRVDGSSRRATPSASIPATDG